jgi:hypothetical protein
VRILTIGICQVSHLRQVQPLIQAGGCGPQNNLRLYPHLVMLPSSLPIGRGDGGEPGALLRS